MKLIPALACSALLLGGAAFAADSGSAPATPATSTAKPAASSKSTASDDCSKQAKEQKLKGKARTKFLKTCRADKK
jgi:hypothetical protein